MKTETLVEQKVKTLHDSLTKKEKFLIEEQKKSNGSFFVAKNFQKEIISDLKECYALWQEFSPQKTIFDTWEFRLAFYNAYQHQPHFILLKNGNQKLGLLPLWYEENKKKYFWFGSWWQEETEFFVKDFSLIPALLSAAPSPMHLNAITKESVVPFKDKFNFERDDSKYVLNLEGFKTHEDYLMMLKKNRRHDLRKDRRRIERQNPEIVINDFSDFKNLVDICKKRFAEKGETTDWDKQRIMAFEEVLRLGNKSYETRMVTVKIGDKIAGVDLNGLYNKTYFTLKCGYDVTNFPGIGNFMNLFEIDDAIKLGMKKIDFLQNNYGWKSQYFQSIPLFKYNKE